MNNVKIIYWISVMLFIVSMQSCAGDKGQSSLPQDNLLNIKDSISNVIPPVILPEKANTSIWDKIDRVANNFKSKAKASQDLSEIDKDFLMFYEKFLQDSLFQVERCDFNNFLGVVSECDTTIILNTSNWKYTDWNFTEFFNSPSDTTLVWKNYYYSSEDTFYYEFILEEVGVIYQVGFERINSRWYLAFYYINAC